MRDLEARLNALATVVPTGNRTATVNGTGIDLQGYDGALVIINADTITDGTHTPKVEESADNSAWNDAVATDLVGTVLVAITAASVQRICYVGAKRYIRVTITAAGTTTGGKYNAVVVRGLAAQQPL